MDELRSTSYRCATRHLAVVAFSLLAACAETPQQIEQEGLLFEFTLQSTPRLAALCAARHSEQIPDASFITQMREMETAGDYEVVVRYGQGVFDAPLPFAVIRMQARNGATAVKISTQRLPKHFVDELLRTVRVHC